MKKIISIVLTVAMLLSMLIAVIPVSAATVPEGYTAVSTVAQFEAMQSGGKYYLTNDLTITKNSTMENGTFDGGGHTITLGNGAISVFGWFGRGTMNVSNLKIEGTVTWDNSQSTFPEHVGPLVFHGGNGWKVDNVTSNVNININFAKDYAAGKGHYFGGIVSKAEGNCSITNSTYGGTVTITGDKLRRSFGAIVGELKYGENTVSNCTNNGKITATASVSNDWLGIGGIVGSVGDETGAVTGEMSITNCTNNGIIDCSVPLANVGGIVGIIKNTSFTISGCSNTKAISGRSLSGTNMGVGGIVGASNYGKAADKKLLINECSNSGALALCDSADDQGASYVGGMIGRVHLMGLFDVLGCKNSGNINVPNQTNSQYGGTGGIVGGFTDLNSVDAVWNIKNCSNSAQIIGNASTGGIIGVTLKIDAPLDFLVSNYVNSGAVTSVSIFAGGIMGMYGSLLQGQNRFDSLTFRNCSNSGSVTAAWEAAGIIANMNVPNGTTLVQNCANSGALASKDATGAWKTAGIIYKCQNTAIVKDCVNTGTLGEGGGPIAPVRDGQTIAKLTTAGNTYSNNVSTTHGTVVSAATATTSVNSINSTASKPDFTEVNAAITLANSKVEADYTEESWAKLESALTKASTALNTTKQLEADAAAVELNGAIASLVRADLNFTSLKAKIAEAEGLDLNKYSIATRAVLNDSIAAAKKALAAIDQETINAARDALAQTMSSLKTSKIALAADHSVLNYWIKEAESLTKEDYTEKTWNAMTEKLTIAKAAQSETNQQEVNAAADVLKAAIQALKKAPVKIESDEEDKTDQTDSTDATDQTEAVDDPITDVPTEPAEEESGCGSAITATAVVSCVLISLGAGIAFKKKED